MISYIETRDKIFATGNFKSNPYNYPIVDKWNKREYNKHKYEIFEIMENVFDEIMTEEYSKRISQMTNITDVIF